MSEFDDLLARLCPNGVEHRPLGEVGEFTRGNGLQKKDFTDSGVGCIHYGQIFTHYGTTATSTKSFVAPELALRLRHATAGDLIIATTSENEEDVCKAVAWLGTAEIAVSGDSYVFRHSLDPRYVAYLFQSSVVRLQKRRAITGTKVKRVSGQAMARFEVPVPPMEVQLRIADTLGSMEELEAGLEAELKARQLQYEYYRDSLLSIERYRPSDIHTLGQVGTFELGHRLTRKDLTPSGIGCVHYGEIYTSYGPTATSIHSFVSNETAMSATRARTGDLVVAMKGETVEDVAKGVAWLGSSEITVSDNASVFRHSLEPRFLAYVFSSKDFTKQKRMRAKGTSIKVVLPGDISKIKIPVPGAREQTRIGDALSALYSLSSDPTVGLPAEIAARRAQYEYYRDELLTFEHAK